MLFRSMMHEMNTQSPMNYFKMLTVMRHCDKTVVDKTFAEIADERAQHPLDVLMDLFAADPSMMANICLAACPEANDILSRHRLAMPCADGMCCAKDSNFSCHDDAPLMPNAMTVSFIPRYILLHGKERFEDTIRQISGYVAQRFGIEGRGVIEEGAFADLVVLDREKLHSYDMDEDFLQYPEGFEHVIVGGVPTVENKRHLGAKAGKMLRKRV